MGDHKIFSAGPTEEILTAELLSQAYGETISLQWTTNTRGREIAVYIAS
jgi:ABC-type cobalamin/Fe3+-siderophores transport system ATPase subunit